MSNPTGARLRVVPSHTMESTKWTRQAIAVQTPYMYVPTFRDPRCHQRGMTDKMSPIPENTVNTVLTTAIKGGRVITGRREVLGGGEESDDDPQGAKHTLI